MEKKPQLIAKENQVTELQSLMEKSSAVILADYRGITVAQDTKLRAKMRAAGVEYRVAKNSLMKRASNNLGYTVLDEHLAGTVSVAFSPDPVAAAKVLGDFIKENRILSFKAGLLEGAFLDAAGVEALAKLPSREVLLSQVAACFNAPLSAVARAFNAYAEQQEAPAAAE